MRSFVVGAAAIALACGSALAVPGTTASSSMSAEFSRVSSSADASPELDTRRLDKAVYEADRNALAELRMETKWLAGCPDALASRVGTCRKGAVAGSAKGLDGTAFTPSFFNLGQVDTGNFSYAAGYLLREAPGGNVTGHVPLLGGALAIGQVWPDDYTSGPLPEYYIDYFDLGTSASYRFANDVIYRVDPQDGTITAIAGILTDDDFVIGEPAPGGYDVYNVPYAFRSRYADSETAIYRYANGYIYRLDAATREVDAVIELLI
jgi:hypothetical protein